MRFLLLLTVNFFLYFTAQAQSDTVKLASGLRYVVLKEGRGGTVGKGDKVLVHYTGRLADGTVFDTSDRERQTVEI